MTKKQKPHAAIAAALATPEDDVEKSSRRSAGSFTAQIAALEVGETASQAKMIDGTLTIDEVKQALPVLRQEMRNNTTRTVARVKAATGGEYLQEVTDAQTHNRNWFLIVLVTRIA